MMITIEIETEGAVIIENEMITGIIIMIQGETSVMAMTAMTEIDETDETGHPRVMIMEVLQNGNGGDSSNRQLQMNKTLFIIVNVSWRLTC